MANKKQRTTSVKPDTSFDFVPRNANQKRVREEWGDAKLLILTGPAGTGKTAAAVSMAFADVMRGESRKVMLCRPMVSVEEDMGFLPGSVEDKITPWLGAVQDTLGSMYSANLESLRGKFEAASVGMLRGRTVFKSTLIVDEAQNSTYQQLVCAATRVGSGGRVVLCGDPAQSDLGITPNPLETFAKRVCKAEGVVWIQFGLADQVRDPFVSRILKLLG